MYSPRDSMLVPGGGASSSTATLSRPLQPVARSWAYPAKNRPAVRVADSTGTSSTSPSRRPATPARRAAPAAPGQPASEAASGRRPTVSLRLLGVAGQRAHGDLVSGHALVSGVLVLAGLAIPNGPLRLDAVSS